MHALQVSSQKAYKDVLSVISKFVEQGENIHVPSAIDAGACLSLTQLKIQSLPCNGYSQDHRSGKFQSAACKPPSRSQCLMLSICISLQGTNFKTRRPMTASMKKTIFLTLSQTNASIFNYK